MCFNVKIFIKILALTANLSHIPRVQKPGLRPTALAFLYPRPGQKPAQAKSQAWLGLAFFGLAWPGFWLLAGAGTSLGCSTLVKEGERSKPSFNKVPILIFLSFGYHVILIKVNTPPVALPWASEACLIY